MKKLKKVLIWLFSIAVSIILIASIYMHFSAYQPSSSANQAAQFAKQNSKETVFKAKNSKLTVIFYPGALVTPNSYSIWSKKVAQAGYTVKIAHFPLNMALFNAKVADQLIEPNEKYVIGGHSLGGVMAARYAKKTKSKNIKGVFLLASYPDEKGSLNNKNISVLSITATRDGVLNWDKYNKSKKYLPVDTSYKSISGGNHGGFGSYGQQNGDKKATISNTKQQAIIANDLIKWLKKIK